MHLYSVKPAMSFLLPMTSSHPLGNFCFAPQYLFSCNDGFSLNGTELLLWASTGFGIDSVTFNLR